MKIKSPLSASIAIAVGLVVLVGSFIQLPILGQLRYELLEWAIILAGFAAIVGILNLLLAHLKRLRATGPARDPLSIVVLLAFLATIVAGILWKPSSANFQAIILNVQRPIESALLAVLAVTLAFACVRLFHRQRGTLALVFLLSAVFFLLLGSGIFNSLAHLPVLGSLVDLLGRLPVAGARGILIGVALGSLTAGLRILMGADRPYGG